MDSQTTAAPTYRLGFIGGGKLAGSVIRGLVRARYWGESECAMGCLNTPIQIAGFGFPEAGISRLANA